MSPSDVGGKTRLLRRLSVGVADLFVSAGEARPLAFGEAVGDELEGRIRVQHLDVLRRQIRFDAEEKLPLLQPASITNFTGDTAHFSRATLFKR